MQFKIVDFFQRESNADKTKILFMAVVSGFANSVLLAMINNATEIVTLHDMDFEARLFLIYSLLFTLFLWTKKFALSQATLMTEEVVRGVRLRLVDKIRHSQLRVIETIEKEKIFNRLSQSILQVSQSATTLINATQAVIVVIAALLYIAWLSDLAFLMTVVFIGSGAVVYIINYQQRVKKLEIARNKETEFYGVLDHVLNGFKELRINQKKSDTVFENINTLAKDTQNARASALLGFVSDYTTSQTAFYLLIGTIIFVVPQFEPAQADMTVVKIVATLLFIMGPVELVVSAIPTIASANVAIKNLDELEAELDDARPTYPDKQDLALMKRFKYIRFENVSFEYKDKQGDCAFALEKIDLQIRQGEILFIVGGNGSGKSTLLKLLAGLYQPNQGAISIDDTLIDEDTYPAYRELFSTIFSDFHLFDKLYGTPNVPKREVKKWLKDMELQQKTQYQDDTFTHLDLSTGQRKRLAYITAMLEDKDIYIFDEWAADQDPQFRRRFYEELIEDLCDAEKTVIVVTHDDKYFSTADRVLYMYDGKLSNMPKGNF